MPFFCLQHSRPAKKAYTQLSSSTKKTMFKICKPVDCCNEESSGENPNQKTMPAKQEFTLEGKLPRFGPAYGDDTAAIKAVKDDAWQHIVNKTLKEEQSELRGTYISAIKRVEKEARDGYESSILKRLKQSDFQWSMVIDGCFFLQLALTILGGHEQLGYPEKHVYFGLYKEEDVSKWIKAMFFVGNQIPCVVIHELMKQSFFQKVITEKGTWKVPSDLPRLVLYLVAVGPVLERLGQSSCGIFSLLTGRGQKRKTTPVFREPPIDILHGLHCLILGPGDDDPLDIEHHDPEETDLDDDRDLESGVDMNDKFLSASELKQSGISIRKAKLGIREIHFKNRFLISPRLYVPPFTFNGNTNLMLRHLMTYETIQQQTKGKREVCAYIRFMGDLVQTERDVHILESKGIIGVRKKLDKVKLPGLLKRLRSSQEMALTQNLRLTRLMVTEYKSLPWHLISLALFLTVVQTVFTILSYVMPRD